MKLNKEEKKQFLITMKELFRKEKYKGGIGSAYKRVGDVLIWIAYDIIQYQKFHMVVEVKKYSYDEFFWDIMNMRDNKKQGDAFRVNGAFVSPFILVERNVEELPEMMEGCEEKYVKRGISLAEEFLEKNNLNDYILHEKDNFDGGILVEGNTLKCLAYCDLGEFEKAKIIAKRQIEKRDTGDYVNEGKGFFEWMLLYNPEK